MILACTAVAGNAVAAPPAAAGDDAVAFNRDIRPILTENCFKCHGPDARQRKAGLRLDDHDGALAKLESGARAVVPGRRDQSELIKRITATDPDDHMPPAKSGKSLTAAQIQLLERWIDQGAPWQRHWAFIAPQRVDPPAVSDPAWPRNPIDHFVMARLDREGLHPSPPADKATLIRRATLDLTGLPPTLAEVDAYLADESPDAYEKVVDRLLGSPRYGEHMAAAWLDAARYADTNGYQGDRTRTMWPWRDWVIAAFNDNLPYDKFTVEQLAGDLLPDPQPRQVLATGFNRNHMLNGEGGRIPEESRVEYVMDRVETTGQVWLGLTVGCTRCHDHKYDPLRQTEYYQLFAYFNNIEESGGVDAGGNARPVMKAPSPDQAAQADSMRKQIAALEAQLKDAKDAPAAPQGAKAPAEPKAHADLKAKLDAQRKALADLEKSIPQTMVMADRKTPREAYVLIVGQYDKPDKTRPVTPGVPACLPPLPKDAPPNRLALARWLVDPANPLPARVAVNRYWQHYFGAGLVRTPEDFGTQGQPPTHPLLLDWLASEFVRIGWDVKAMQRLIVTSATYRQSSRQTPQLIERDPDNRLLARGPRFRMTSLAIRDQALALSGLLVDKVGGPPVKPYQPDGVWADFSLGKMHYEPDHGQSLYRRSLYTFWRRSVGPTMFFDTPARQVCTVRQSRTNTPLHALTVMNDITFVEAARAMAQRVMADGGAGPEQRIAYAFRLATARRPSDAELKVLLAGYQRALSQYQGDKDAAAKLLAVGESPRNQKLDPVEHAAYTAVMTVILNLDEVLTKE